MAYVREKHYRGRDGSTHIYYQLVQSVRVDGKPRQRVLVHMGAHGSVDAALEAWPDELDWWHYLAEQARQQREQHPWGSPNLRMLYIGTTTSGQAVKVYVSSNAAIYERKAAHLQTQLERLRAYAASVVPKRAPRRDKFGHYTGSR